MAQAKSENDWGENNQEASSMSRSTPDYHIPDSREWTDIAVVGLGAAGAFAADQLTKGWVSKRIKVIAYEAQSRVGGRLLSPQLPRVADASNLGAMRADDAHKLVKSCSDDVGVALDTFDLSNLTAWRVRGKIFHAGHETPLKTYTLRDDVLALAITDPGDLIRYVTLRTLAATDFPDLSGPERTAALDWQKQVLEALDFKHAKPQPFPRDGWPLFYLSWPVANRWATQCTGAGHRVLEPSGTLSGQ